MSMVERWRHVRTARKPVSLDSRLHGREEVSQGSGSEAPLKAKHRNGSYSCVATRSF